MGLDPLPDGQMSLDDVLQARAVDAWAAQVAATWVFAPIVVDLNEHPAITARRLSNLPGTLRQE